MFSNFTKFGDLLINNEIIIKFSMNRIQRFNKTIENHLFLLILQKSDLEKNTSIVTNLKESPIVLIDEYKEDNENSIEKYFIISFHKTLLIINQSSMPFFGELISNNQNIPFYFLGQTRILFDQLLSIQNDRFNCDEIFIVEINNFNDSLIFSQKKGPSLFQIWKNISQCLIGYIIKESYSKLNIKQNCEIIFDTSKYIELRPIDSGSSGTTFLIYHIVNQELYAIKRYLDVNNEKSYEREKNNYSCLDYFLIPKFYGIVKENKYLVFQYIDGKTLGNIRDFDFSEDEKITIIFKLIMTINYLHKKGYVYRDLKPNNVIIDKNKNVYVIDFDKMVKYSDEKDFTTDFSSLYIDPEIYTGEISYKNDIYSIGQMIYYIMNETNPPNQIQINDFEYYIDGGILEQFYSNCTNEIVDKRPNISELMFEFYIFYRSQIMSTSLLIKNDPDLEYLNGIISLDHMYISKDVNKFIKYYELAANANILEAQYKYSVFLMHGEYIKPNINKAIHYLTLACDEKNCYFKSTVRRENNSMIIDVDYNSKNILYSEASFLLGQIYFNGKFIKPDINKALKYWKNAADEFHPEALVNMGYFYLDGKFTKQDINQGIYYYKLAAEHNVPEAKFVLGYFHFHGIYIEKNIDLALYYLHDAAHQQNPKALLFLGNLYSHYNSCVKQDINKAIELYSLASNLNLPEAQYKLGLIYMDDYVIQKDIKKSIFYLTLAAENHHAYAMNELARLYYNGHHVMKNIEKSIYYMEKAADFNCIEAQHALGSIFYEGIYVSKNINKAIRYLTLAANQNYPFSQALLGIIYYNEWSIPRDIKKSIYYFSLSAKQNICLSQYFLGEIYYYGINVEKNIQIAIHYLKLAANQNFPVAQCFLGWIYYNNKDIPVNIDLSIYYFMLSARLNYSDSQFHLGIIYYEGKYVQKDIYKAIHYFRLAANQNNSSAQYFLGFIYIADSDIEQNFEKGIFYLQNAAENGNIDAHYALGFLYHKGKYVEKNIKKAIHYYKEASSFNHSYAKNNLGIIYEYGYKDEIEANQFYAIEYFEEAIRNKLTYLSAYNLSHIYIYDSNNSTSEINKAISLLVESLSQFFFDFNELLLCIALIKKYGFDLYNIKQELSNQNCKFTSNIIEIIKTQNFFDNFKNYYLNLKEISFVYHLPCDIWNNYVFFQNQIDFNLPDNVQPKKKKYQNISSEFYEGFGIDLKIL